MANLKYSFSNPMRAYASIKKELTMSDLDSFRKKYEKTLVFKQAKFWIGSITGFNQTGVNATDYSLCVGDALGHEYYFPYALQNSMLKFFDRKDTLGIAQAVTSGKSVGPFNWRTIIVDNALIGYVLNVLNCSISVTSEWTAKNLNEYKSLIANIQMGKVKGAFMPYYLAPKELKPLIKHSLLATRGVFGIGALLLFDYSNGYTQKPCAIIPDIDFVTQFDLTPFSALSLGKYYNDYLEQLEMDKTGKLIRCNSPKPKDLKINVGGPVKEGTDNKGNNTINRNQLMLAHLKKLLEKPDSLVSTANLFCLHKQMSLSNNNKLEIKLGLVKSLGDKLNNYPSFVDIVSQKKDKVPLFKPKENQKLNLNVIFTFDDVKTQFNYIAGVGLYGTSELCMEAGRGVISANDIMGQTKDVETFVRLVTQGSYDMLINEVACSFDEQVLRGIEEGIDNPELILKNCVKKESEDVYKITFNADSSYQDLEIRKAQTGLSYKLALVGSTEDEPLDLNFCYEGDMNITEVVSQLVKAAENTLKSMTE